MTEYEDAQIAINKLIADACESTQFIDLAGVQGEEGYEVSPYDQLARIFENALRRVRFLKSHRHEWDDDDYCIHCGADGRA